MISYTNNYAVFLFMKLSYFMIGVFYFYFHPNLMYLLIFSGIYFVYMIYEMNKEVFSFRIDRDSMYITSFLSRLINRQKKINRDQLDLLFIKKKQDYVFNNNKIFVNNRHRISSMYWNKDTFEKMIKDLDSL